MLSFQIQSASHINKVKLRLYRKLYFVFWLRIFSFNLSHIGMLHCISYTAKILHISLWYCGVQKFEKKSSLTAHRNIYCSKQFNIRTFFYSPSYIVIFIKLNNPYLCMFVHNFIFIAFNIFDIIIFDCCLIY